MSTATRRHPGPPLFDDTRLAIVGFLARYSGPTHTGPPPSYQDPDQDHSHRKATAETKFCTASRGHPVRCEMVDSPA